MAKQGEIFRVQHVSFPKGLFSSNRVRAMVLNAMKEEGKAMQKDLRSTVEHWVHKPDFVYQMRYRGGDVILSVGPYGSTRANKYWSYVNKGTMRRYVIFNPNYVPKTQYPGSFYSNTPGAHTGKDKIVGKSSYPLPGIKARDWTRLLNEKYRLEYALKMAQAIKRGLEPK